MDDKDKKEELDSLEGRENSIANKINSYITTSKSSYGNNGKFKCNVCGKKGRSKQTIQNHIKVNHMKQIATSQPVRAQEVLIFAKNKYLFLPKISTYFYKNKYLFLQ